MGGIRPRLTWFVAGLLLVETAGLLVCEVAVLGGHVSGLLGTMRADGHVLAVIALLALVPAAAVTLAAAAGALFAPYHSWLLAMLAQVLTLGGCLLVHATLGAARPGGLYVLMAFGVLMVPYLNSGVVRTTMLPLRDDD